MKPILTSTSPKTKVMVDHSNREDKASSERERKTISGLTSLETAGGHTLQSSDNRIT